MPKSATRGRFVWKRRRAAVVFVGGLLLLYVGSYIILSACGGWWWSQTGRLRYSFGFSVSDVERWFPAGADWEPFHDIYGNDTSRGGPLGYLYSPLIRIDRAWFHADRPIFPETADAK